MHLFADNNMISIHAPTRGATIYLFKIFASAFISIHAPTRGATKTPKTFKAVFDISIHAPTRGATIPFILETALSDNFNPRSYKRSDSTESFKVSLTSISIHAPTRGATCFQRYMQKILERFQSTLLQEERLNLGFLLYTFVLFQSTLLQEERHIFI